MIRRCESPLVKEYSCYGGRGISVCDRWHDFRNFLADVGERPPGMTLDRMNNDGPYDPGNFRWATRAEQARNRRGLVRLTINGRTQCMKDWCGEFGLSYYTVNWRIRAGWSYADALSREPGPSGRRRVTKGAP